MQNRKKNYRIVAGGIVTISFVIVAALLMGCPGEDDTMEVGPEGQVDPAEPDQAQMPEPEDIDPEELGLPGQEQLPDTEDVDIEDPDRDSETSLATVNGEEVTLQDLYDEFDRLPPQQQQQLQNQQPQLLEQIIQQKLLADKVREKEIQESRQYEEMLQQIEASPIAAEMDEEQMKESAMIEVLLQQEVVEKVDIQEEDVREAYEEYAQMMPEDAGYEQMKPQLEQILLQDHVINYIQQLTEDAEVEINEEWVAEKQQEALDASPPMMPEGEAPPVQ